MTITLELSAAQERRLRQGAARHDAEIVRQVLMQAVDRAVETLLHRPQDQPAPQQRSALLDELASEAPNAPALPDHAVSRAGIYGNHP